MYGEGQRVEKATEGERMTHPTPRGSLMSGPSFVLPGQQRSQAGAVLWRECCQHCYNGLNDHCTALCSAGSLRLL